MKNCILSALSSLWISLSCGMVHQKLPVYMVPCLGNLNSRNYVQQLIGEHAEIIAVPTPLYFPDLGQRRCLSYLCEAISRQHNGALIHAASQGTATALNYLAHENVRQTIGGVILEAPLVSGNSAIYHTVQGPLMGLRKLADLPLAYYWLPYIAKCIFLLYSPSGRQPITYLNKINNNIPIIIVHSQGDPQLSYNDACALYYGLRAQGNQHVYFISQNTGYHLELLSSKEAKETVRAILQKYNFLPEQAIHTPDLSKYQPNHLCYKHLYEDLLQKEIRHQRLGYAVMLGVGTLVLYIVKKYIARR